MLIPGLLNYIISYLRAADLHVLYLIILEIWSVKHTPFLPSKSFPVENGCWEMYRDLKINFVSDDLD